MFGAVIGDMIGSVYEFHNVKSKSFALWTPESKATDDTVCTIAIAEAMLNRAPFEGALRTWGRRYPDVGYGAMFQSWLESDTMPAYKSWGNGAVMRLSPIAFLSPDKTHAILAGFEATGVTHNTTEALMGTEAYLDAFFALKSGEDATSVRAGLSHRYGYNMNRSVDEVRATYNRFYVRCSKTVPEAIICALEATDFEDAIRNAVSLGGDSDTLAAMTGALAEVRFGIPPEMMGEVRSRLDGPMLAVLERMYRVPHTICRQKLSYHPLTGQRER